MKNSAREILLAQSARDRCRGKGAKDSANGCGKSKYYIISLLLYAIGISAAQIIILFTKRTGIHIIIVLLLRSLSGIISFRGASRKHPRKCLLVSTRRRMNRASRAESLLRVNFPGKPFRSRTLLYHPEQQYIIIIIIKGGERFCVIIIVIVLRHTNVRTFAAAADFEYYFKSNFDLRLRWKYGSIMLCFMRSTQLVYF